MEREPSVCLVPPRVPPGTNSPAAVVGQFAVEPDLQRAGLGTALLQQLERRAQESGAIHVALDTAEGATHLIRYYERLGFTPVEWVQWDVTNYRSLVLSKPLTPVPANPPVQPTGSADG